MVEEGKTEYVDLTKIDLHGRLEGCWIKIDEEKVTFGALEDLESNSIVRMRSAFETIIHDSNLPKPHEKATMAETIKALTRRQARALIEGVGEYVQVPKS